jgi:hypothetical protein
MPLLAFNLKNSEKTETLCDPVVSSEDIRKGIQRSAINKIEAEWNKPFKSYELSHPLSSIGLIRK